jgi:hypothetical protein
LHVVLDTKYGVCKRWLEKKSFLERDYSAEIWSRGRIVEIILGFVLWIRRNHTVTDTRCVYTPLMTGDRWISDSPYTAPNLHLYYRTPDCAVACSMTGQLRVDAPKINLVFSPKPIVLGF